MLPQAPVAQAVINPNTPAPPRVQPLIAGPPADITLTDTGAGTSVTGAIDLSGTFDPTAQDYPSSIPAGFTPKDEDFAGVIIGTPSDGSADITLYCIDIQTDTYVGIDYSLGTWDASNVARVGFVTRILNEYYPNTNEPASLTDLNQKAAAVQAAIWYFTDLYVLQPGDPLHDSVAAIVDHVRAEGPAPAPTPPTLTITPTTLSGPAGTPVGPFTVTTSNPAGATVSTTGGASMFADANLTMPIAQGATVFSSQQIWLESPASETDTLQASSVATVPAGNVYLHTG
ncbi:MAG: thioester domain-containing protein, partial [Chloroflexi bacterium]|nr:thioester domain-containing protein [Chloroflexota bacterium]